MKIGLISDLHLYRKTNIVIKALECMQNVDLLLIAGDLVDSGTREQYDLLTQCIQDTLPAVPILSVSGNHDNPQKDDMNYRAFEKRMSERCNALEILRDPSGAFMVNLDDDTDLFGLNPQYRQKVFSFPEGGQQLAYLESKLSASMMKRHIIMCHAPLIAHNPQRSADMQPYFSKEQDRRLQDIVNECGNVVFLSGHTHIEPMVEFDGEHNNLYINDGSIRPTTVKGGNGETKPGNVTIIEISEEYVSVLIRSIFSSKTFIKGKFCI